VEQKIFDIVNQFDAAAALIATDQEREQVAELNLLAGARAKTATAYAAALRYFEAGRALLSQNGWERHYQLTFDLELNCGDCEYLTGEFAVSEKRLSALSARAQTAVDSAAVTCALLNLYINLDHNDRAVEGGMGHLSRVDGELSVRATEEDVRREYGRLRDRLGSGSIEALLELPLMSDPVRRGTIDVLTAMALPALFTDLHLFRILVFRTVAISLQHGNSDGSTLAYVRLGGILGTHLGDYQAGLRFGRLGLDLVEKRRLARQKARVYFVFAAHVAHWTQDLPTCLAFLRRAFDSAQEAGDYA